MCWHLWIRNHGISKGNQVCPYLSGTDRCYHAISALPLSGPGRRWKINFSQTFFCILWRCSRTLGLHQQNTLLCQLVAYSFLGPEKSSCTSSFPQLWSGYLSLQRRCQGDPRTSDLLLQPPFSARTSLKVLVNPTAQQSLLHSSGKGN